MVTDQLRVVLDRVERALVLGIGLVDVELVERLVGSDHREAVDVGLRRDGLGLGDAGRGLVGSLRFGD
jgi:hypothetical protein